MPHRDHIGLDNQHFNGRLRQRHQRAQFGYVPVTTNRPSARYFSDIQVTTIRSKTGTTVSSAAAKPTRSVPIVKPQPFVTAKRHEPKRSQVLKRQSVRRPLKNAHPKHAVAVSRRSKAQVVMFAMAFFIFAVGLAVSYMTYETNKSTKNQVAALAKQSTDQSSGASSADDAVPSTTPPSPTVIKNYTVAPNLPKYLDIPKLHVHSRVLSLGILSSGALAAPSNIYDAGWYNESSSPGQSGAMLIDGHATGYNAAGIFYGLPKLVAGDTISVTRGDNTTYTYKVVKSQVYDANHVDMASALTPVVVGKPGLNLITCDGQVDPHTYHYNQRIIIYAVQV
ncbi:MAG TPA: class F sortase [Candidatus Saccharimonadales bacterium]|nr:class F sortase [Candidatus Saccharimonadales bacterium]